MSAAHIHLLLNHVPILGTIFALLLLTFAIWRGKDESTRVSLGAFVIVGLASVVVYLTGEAAEEALEHLPGFSEEIMERHEEAALVATIGSALLGGFALVGLGLYRRREVPGWFRGAVLVLALAVTGLMAWTANTGGQVVHREIRPASSSVPAGPPRLWAREPAGSESGTRHLVGRHQGGVTQRAEIRIPESMRLEHEEIHEALVMATKATGPVGEAARELARVLHPHFVREEQIALPPLGLLAPLARGEFSEEMRAVLPLTDSLRAELPDMLREHRAIGAAARRLEEVAALEGDAETEALARKLQLHARTEEEVTYPAALLVGRLVRLSAARD